MRFSSAALFSLIITTNASAEISGRYYDPEYTSDPKTSCELPTDSVVSFTKQSIDFHENSCRIQKVERWSNSATTFDYFVKCSNGKRQRLMIEEAKDSIWVQWTEGKRSKTAGIVYKRCPAPSSPNANAEASRPTIVGRCTKTQIVKITDRFGKPILASPNDSSGTMVSFSNGAHQISYEKVFNVINSRVGDTVETCLVSMPKDCPKGDDRGRIYRTTNLRTTATWILPDSQHSCGGA